MSYSTFNLSEKLNLGVTICGAAVFLLLPSINIAWLMNGSQSGKTFFFLYMVIIITLITSARLIFEVSTALRVTILDGLLAMWVVYAIGNGLIHGLPITLRFLDFCGLIIFYISLRQLSATNLYWLFISFILGGGIQAVQGNLQLWGGIPSTQNMFKVTGSFFNPGPYSGYLANVFIAAFGFYLYGFSSSFFKGRDFIIQEDKEKSTKFLYVKQKIEEILRPSYEWFSHFKTLLKHPGLGIKGFALTVLFIIVLALSASISRASFLAILVASFYITFSKFKLQSHMFLRKILNSLSWRIALTVFVVILIIFIGVGLYYLNRDSANGRKLIWTISLNMIRDNPVFGTGFEHFKSHYMNYQAAYFKGYPDAGGAMIAGDTTYAFNELLQVTVENGTIGLALFVWILVTILRKRQTPYSDVKTGSDILYTIAKACIISVFIFSLFSYPSQILPIKICLILALATISKFLPCNKYLLQDMAVKRTGILSATRLRFVYFLLSLSVIFVAFWKIQSYVSAYRDWELASESYQWEDYSASVKYYQEAYGKLKDDGDFLTAYGKALSMAERYKEAITVLKQAAGVYPNTVLFLALGDSYKALRCYDKAEGAYLHSMYMNPGRLFPKYLLVKLYEEWGHKKEAINVAGELLKQPVKVESTAVREIREEMKALIKEHNSSK